MVTSDLSTNITNLSLDQLNNISTLVSGIIDTKQRSQPYGNYEGEWYEKVWFVIRDTLLGSIYHLKADFWISQWHNFLISLFVLAIGAGAMFQLLHLERRRQKAYVLATVAAGITATLAVPISITMIGTYVKNPEAFEWTFLSSSPYCDFLVVFYLTYLYADMICGAIFYREHIEPLVGWFHHIIYICLCSNTLAWQWTNGFGATLVEEIPTALLAIGSVAPGLRSDIGFGISFIATRLIYHFTLTGIVAKELGHVTVVWLLGLTAGGVHIWWFIKWINMMKKYGALDAEAAEDDLAEELEILLEEQASASLANLGSHSMETINSHMKLNSVSDLITRSKTFLEAHPSKRIEEKLEQIQSEQGLLQNAETGGMSSQSSSDGGSLTNRV